MSGRLWTRLFITGLALRQWLAGGARHGPTGPQRILVIAPLFAGDALLLTPLLAKLRQQHPSCELYLLAGGAVQTLYQHRPYGVQAGVFDPRDLGTLLALRRWPGADLAIVAGESRYSWLALALGARWIVGFGGERRWLQNWALDERIALPQQPTAWGDMAAMLVRGAPAAPYHAGDWPDPEFAPFEFPPSPYCLLHVQASSPLKHWEDAKWLALAEWLASRGMTVVWSAGRGGKDLVERIDPIGRFSALGWRLDLAQLWHLVKRAALLVSVDTSVGHIGRLTATPTLVLFGPGSASLYGAGDFWRESPWRAATVPDFPCRDRQVLFKREIPWIRRCDRGSGECAAPRCMHSIELDPVRAQIDQLLARTSMTFPAAQDITRAHDGFLAQTRWASTAQPAFQAGAWQFIEANHRCNNLLWDEEDQARRKDVPDSAIAANKHAIDGYNQRRNDAIERIDETLLALLEGVPRRSDARMSSETAGAMIDRLSILALRIFHMRLQTQRTDASREHIETCVAKLERLEEQRRDLAACLDRMLAECTAGTAYFKVYRQFKMYNDPALNPYLYGGKLNGGKQSD